MTTSTPTIAIVGGGLSGLVLGRILQVHGIPFTIYALDASANTRRQGGSLDIHEESGQFALREAGLHDEFVKYTHPGGEATRVLDKNGTVYIDEDPQESERGRPEIDRTDLRAVLLGSLDPERIAWDHKLVSARALDGGHHELTFANGERIEADLVIGADGAWSRVRALLSDAKPAYVGVALFEVHVPHASVRQPETAALVGSGALFAASDNKYVAGHGGDDVWLGYGLRVPEDWPATRGIDWSDASAAREVLLGEFADWDPVFTNPIRSNEGEITPRPIYALPVGLRWERTPGVTAVGDAAHLMSPFAGEGANAALLDGAELALALIGHLDDVETALAQYESVMFPRAEDAAAGSAQGRDLIFSDDAPHPLVDFFSSMGGPEGPSGPGAPGRPGEPSVA